MTHKDIYTKFMIEYDKANVTSSYPSLTEYEVATVLDKAYNALIAQKITGNNFRRAGFESDVKAISDIAPLIVSGELYLTPVEDYINIAKSSLPENPKFLYFVEGNLWRSVEGTPMDKKSKRPTPVQLVPHSIAKKFFATTYNMPWIKNPVCYIEDGLIFVVYDSYKTPEDKDGGYLMNITYIKVPNKFAKDLNNYNEFAGTWTWFDHPEKFDNRIALTPDSTKEKFDKLLGTYKFECNDTVAEELVSLAVAFALENVESPRLNNKLNMRGLEA